MHGHEGLGSATSESWRPRARSASIRASSAVNRSSSRRAISVWAKGSRRRVRKCGPPECEGVPKRQRSAFRLAAREPPADPAPTGPRTDGVEPLWRNTQHVARRLGEQELVAGSVGEQSPELREIDVQDRLTVRGAVSPRLLDQSLARDGLVRVQEEKAEERALFRTTEREYSLAPATSSGRRIRNSRSECLRRSIVRTPFREYDVVGSVCSTYSSRIAGVFSGARSS